MRRDIFRRREHRVRALHRQRLLARHGLARQMPKGEIDGLGLGPHSIPVHDYLDVRLLDFDIRTDSAHSPTIHVTCTVGVPNGHFR